VVSSTRSRVSYFLAHICTNSPFVGVLNNLKVMHFLCWDLGRQRHSTHKTYLRRPKKLVSRLKIGLRVKSHYVTCNRDFTPTRMNCVSSHVITFKLIMPNKLIIDLNIEAISRRHSPSGSVACILFVLQV
jgi:hypothetical protein